MRPKKIDCSESPYPKMHATSLGVHVFGFKFSQENNPEPIILQAPRKDGPYVVHPIGNETYCIKTNPSPNDRTYIGTSIRINPDGDTVVSSVIFWTKEKLAEEIDSIPMEID